MKGFDQRVAVVTGGGSGMGRELTRQLVREGCNVAICDLSEEGLNQTKRICVKDGLEDVLLTMHICDVSVEEDVLRVREEIKLQHNTDKIHLLFNNAGVGGGTSIVADDRAHWDRVFNTCWGGVYLFTRTFLPLLINAEEAHIINTSSLHGFWATKGPKRPNSAYSAAKFAVKGFSEALITDLGIYAPHVKCSVVMPGHIGTTLAFNSRKIQRNATSERLLPEELIAAREKIAATGGDPSSVTDEELQQQAIEYNNRFAEAPTSATEAATIILNGVKAGSWRILVGDDAVWIDEKVRQAPERAYDQDFYDAFVAATGWQFGN